jgi:hypothetical protein
MGSFPAFDVVSVIGQLYLHFDMVTVNSEGLSHALSLLSLINLLFAEKNFGWNALQVSQCWAIFRCTLCA